MCTSEETGLAAECSQLKKIYIKISKIDVWNSIKEVYNQRGVSKSELCGTVSKTFELIFVKKSFL